MTTTNPTSDELKKWIAEHTRPMRGRPDHFILDGVSHDFFLIINCESGDYPEAVGTCDVLISKLFADDFLADGICLVSNLDKDGVVRLLEAMKIDLSHRWTMPL